MGRRARRERWQRGGSLDVKQRLVEPQRALRGSIFALLPILGLACSKEAAELGVRLDIPLRGTEQAMVVGIQAEGGGPLLVRALPIEDGVPPVLTQAFMPAEDLAITALLYERTLGELGLVEGPLETQIPADAPSKPLPDPNRILSARVADGMSTGFVPETRVTGLLAELRIRDGFAPTCAVFDTRSIPLGDRATVHFVLGVGHGALLATDAKQAVYVTLDEGPRPLQGPAIELFDAFASESGELWLSGQGGQILRGRLEPEHCTDLEGAPCTTLSTTVVATMPSREDLRWISGPLEGEVTEVFTLSGNGALERFDVRTGQADPAQFQIRTGSGRNRGGLARVGPNEAVAVLYNNASVFRWKEGTTTEEMLGPLKAGANDMGPSSASSSDFGTIVGSWSGQLYRNTRDAEVTWENVGLRFQSDNIVAITGYEGGFVFLDSAGRIAQFLPRTLPADFCDFYAAAMGTQDDPRDVTVVGRDVVAAGAAKSGQAQSFVRWLVRR